MDGYQHTYCKVQYWADVGHLPTACEGRKAWQRCFLYQVYITTTTSVIRLHLPHSWCCGLLGSALLKQTVISRRKCHSNSRDSGHWYLRENRFRWGRLYRVSRNSCRISYGIVSGIETNEKQTRIRLFKTCYLTLCRSSAWVLYFIINIKTTF